MPFFLPPQYFPRFWVAIASRPSPFACRAALHSRHFTLVCSRYLDEHHITDRQLPAKQYSPFDTTNCPISTVTPNKAAHSCECLWSVKSRWMRLSNSSRCQITLCQMGPAKSPWTGWPIDQGLPRQRASQNMKIPRQNALVLTNPRRANLS